MDEEVADEEVVDEEVVDEEVVEEERGRRRRKMKGMRILERSDIIVVDYRSGLS